MLKIISILSQKGGGGKSTLARCLAVELTKQKQKTLLIDLDIQQKTSWEWSERRKRKRVRPLINCQYYPFFDEKLTKSPYDYLIIDGPAKISKESLLIAKHSDLVIQPVRPSLDDLNPAIREFHALAKAGINKKKLAFVINCVSSTVEEKNTREYLTEAGYFTFPIALLDKVSYREAQNQGLSIGEVKYPRLKKQVQLLVKKIITYRN
ncbi:MAG: ParA family protein [Candidatus Moeniiplasma glomeromycotorum]|nr:ParA family protein [Candidatus Moeniiplasma glomeromycotorum]MCE8167203.1 ParA family protein [Candidatus Moeniiplasma glomeromycotorum]MCE8168785.1 ParA family protein [Candidatus Moeniiplasma glomeromycotorum]